MNIIFLDIDGVLNTESHLNALSDYAGYSTLTLLEKRTFHFSTKALQQLNSLIRETQSKIVISSTWRKNTKNLIAMHRVFSMYNLDLHIIDYTPNSVIDLAKNRFQSTRCWEIHIWLQNNKQYKIDSFVILDDVDIIHNDEKIMYLQKHFVKINPELGLNEDAVQAAKKILCGNLM